VKVAIVGGKLQGIEAAFLAREAGWEVTLIDRKQNPPAVRLCQSFYRCDIVEDVSFLRRIIGKVDLIIPALEDITALRALQKCAAEVNIPLAYDAKAYFITHSKKRSNRLFQKLAIPLPQSWPQCGPPLIVKPSASSGSQGVSKLGTEQEVDDFIQQAGSGLKNWVLQEYVEGPSYSIEVLGLPGHYVTPQVTELGMDCDYDCNRVIAPAEIPASLDRQIKQIALIIAQSLRLRGIMDVEVILNQGVPKVLEIDARLPSQTPTAVYESTGINMLELLGHIFVRGIRPTIPEIKTPRGVVYEHISASQKGLEFPGEHIIGEADDLEIVHNFFGADAGVTNFNSSFPWVATLITTGQSREQAWLKRQQVIENIQSYLERQASCQNQSEVTGPTGMPSLSRG
jgi:pyrrolysine biosynthesis protein PylC